MVYTAEDELLFAIEIENAEERMADARAGVCGYRRKTIKAGSSMEIEIYPIWNTRGAAARAARAKETLKAQANQNEKNARKRFVRLLNANFTESDFHAVNTYEGYLPTEKEARRDAQNFFERWQRARRRAGLPKGRYMYVIEYENEPGRKKRIHQHFVLEGGAGLSRDAIEDLWYLGRSNVRRLQPDEFGLEGLGRYLMKNPKGAKRWGGSRGLKQPKITISDTRITRRRAEKLVMDYEEARTMLENMYKGYKLYDLVIKFSEYVAGAYIYARLHRWGDEKNKKKRRKTRETEGLTQKPED